MVHPYTFHGGSESSLPVGWVVVPLHPVPTVISCGYDYGSLRPQSVSFVFPRPDPSYKVRPACPTRFLSSVLSLDSTACRNDGMFTCFPSDWTTTARGYGSPISTDTLTSIGYR